MWVSILVGDFGSSMVRGPRALRQGRLPLHPAFLRKDGDPLPYWLMSHETRYLEFAVPTVTGTIFHVPVGRVVIGYLINWNKKNSS
jgi:hypothetical protein